MNPYYDGSKIYIDRFPEEWWKLPIDQFYDAMTKEVPLQALARDEFVSFNSKRYLRLAIASALAYRQFLHPDEKDLLQAAGSRLVYTERMEAIEDHIREQSADDQVDSEQLEEEIVNFRATNDYPLQVFEQSLGENIAEIAGVSNISKAEIALVQKESALYAAVLSVAQGYIEGARKLEREGPVVDPIIRTTLRDRLKEMDKAVFLSQIALPQAALAGSQQVI